MSMNFLINVDTFFYSKEGDKVERESRPSYHDLHQTTTTYYSSLIL